MASNRTPGLRRDLCGDIVRSRRGHDDDFADVFCLRHGAKRVFGLSDRKLNVGQGGQGAVSQQRDQLGKHLLAQGWLLSHERNQIDGKKGDVLFQQAHVQLAVPVNVAFADLQKAPVGAEGGEALGDCLSGQRVQHQIDALAVGAGHDFVGEVQSTGIHDTQQRLAAASRHASRDCPPWRRFLRQSAWPDARRPAPRRPRPHG